jgi:hypothetical protein
MLDMYTELYKDLCGAGIACEHEEPLWRNADGEVVESEEESLGLKSKFEPIHPDMLIFVDESGCNTDQKQDGDNEKYLFFKKWKATATAVMKDSHFTVLGFTAADAKIPLCVQSCSPLNRFERSGCWVLTLSLSGLETKIIWKKIVVRVNNTLLVQHAT